MLVKYRGPFKTFAGKPAVQGSMFKVNDRIDNGQQNMIVLGFTPSRSKFSTVPKFSHHLERSLRMLQSMLYRADTVIKRAKKAKRRR
jgi:hypothetical protein